LEKYITILSNQRSTPLIEAINKQYYDIAVMLINHGANPNIGANNYQKTPLHLAASKK